MLSITVDAVDLFREDVNEFIVIPEMTIELEHSLVSLSKWESKWEKPFLSKDEKTDEETLDYIRCMTLSPDVPPELYNHLSSETLETISDYINAKRSATWFSEKGRKAPSREIITSELIYYWMISLSIPFEAETWHLSRLLTLIRVANEKNNPSKKKMSRSELAARNRELNAQRRANLNTSG